ncbi:acyl-CoA/acyl-ACP dehydrogenase (plasmid) [Streptomyces sp. NBC_01460]|uniref:acyl-CoA dehydrogenase family protein n=1 Tax=Streptomyces sp. NBC_01460 TaxID=2903875 RepID=UPI002E35D557|nr:acyl-CoA dehydrogenase family protein [Streptomyces sp. NBC_01460]
MPPFADSPSSSRNTLEQAAGTHDRATALRRAALLDGMLGDPLDPGNPHGFTALAEFDRDRRPPVETEQLLAVAGMGSELVPVRHGGMLARADLLMRVLRPVFRRDVALGLGCGISSSFAASAVWAAGNATQQSSVAALLLGGGRITVVHPGLGPAGGVSRDGFTLRRPADGRPVLDGCKDVIMDAERAGAFVLHAATATAAGPHSHSALLLDPARLPAGRMRLLPRAVTPGLRAAVFSGLRFTRCPVPENAFVGRAGEGVALALRTNQINRCLLAGAVTAAVDPVLRSAVSAATANSAASPARRWRRPLAGVFADLLACDALAQACLRAASLVPERAHVPTVAATYMISALLGDALDELSAVLGSAGRQGDGLPHGLLAKLTRDLPAAGLGRAGAAACQAVIVPQLRTLANRSWFVEAEPPPGLFGESIDLPRLDHRLLTFAGDADFLAAYLAGSAERIACARAADGRTALLGRFADGFLGELRVLREQCRALPGRFGASMSGPWTAALSDRYGLVVTAAAVLGTWEAEEDGASFLADPGWALLALSRLAYRAGIEVPNRPEDCVTGVLDELLSRQRTGRGFDLDGAELTR